MLLHGPSGVLCVKHLHKHVSVVGGFMLICSSLVYNRKVSHRNSPTLSTPICRHKVQHRATVWRSALYECNVLYGVRACMRVMLRRHETPCICRVSMAQQHFAHRCKDSLLRKCITNHSDSSVCSKCGVCVCVCVRILARNSSCM